MRRLVVLALVLLITVPLAAKKDPRVEALPEAYRQWLEDVTVLISDDEREVFLALEKDYQRDAFIERFWKVRDRFRRSARNEFKDEYLERVAASKSLFGNLTDERANTLLLNGPPDQRIEISCRDMWPMEVWYYEGTERYGAPLLLLFYLRWGQGNFRLWQPLDGLGDLSQDGQGSGFSIEERCGMQRGEAVLAAIGFLNSLGGNGMGAVSVMARIREKPEAPEKEWVATFSTYSTDLEDGAETFDADLELTYPGRYQSRTVVQIGVQVPVAALVPSELGDQPIYNLMLNGEILAEGDLLENFRYKYDFPLGQVSGDLLPLVFQRKLRPGEYQLIVKVEDIASGRLHRSEQQITVPHVDAVRPPEPSDPETARLLAEANAAIANGLNTIKIIPLRGEWQTGLVRIDTLTTGDAVDKVSFFLDGDPLMSKRRPPYNVEIDLGQVPRARVLRVSAYDAEGNELANDEQTLNAGDHRFAVRLVEPRQGKLYSSSVRARAEVIVPEGEAAGKVELYLNETLVTTLYQPPWEHPIVLPESDFVAYVRAVAYTPDGNATEDTVFINAPDLTEEVDVNFVELYTAVLDGAQRPVEGLTGDDFRVFEDGVAQEITRFDQVRNLPIHVAVMLDVSASMEEELGESQAAALSFFEQAVTPKDRAAVITFNDHPFLAAKFTNEVDKLASGLAGVKAERGTALYDSLIFALYYFNGIRGQRAVLLLSDGKDESSQYEFDDALEFARRAGVVVYAVGLNLKGKDAEAKRKLARITDETGGRTFFIDDAAELEAIYEAIQRELRSRYLLAYQSSNATGSKAFRRIEVDVTGRGEAKTLRGYYP